MALPTVDEVKDYLRVEHDADDDLITALRTAAIGAIQIYLGVPIVGVERTYSDRALSGRRGGPTSLILPVTPIDPATLEVVDLDGNDVDAADLTVDAATGIVRYTDGSPFPFGPYAITVEVGLEFDPEYEDTIEPVLGLAIRDVVADWYRNRNPRATNESSSGVSVSYTVDELPPRVRATLNPLRRSL